MAYNLIRQNQLCCLTQQPYKELSNSKLPRHCVYPSSAFALILCRASFERILRINAVYRAIGPAIPTSAYLHAASLGASCIYWPIAAPIQAQRKSPSQATHVSHLDEVFHLLLHRHKIQETTVYCPIRRT
jgi:hypothetical protein